MIDLSPESQEAAEHFRRGFLALIEADKRSPAEVDRVLAAFVATVRSWRPQALKAQEETP